MRKIFCARGDKIQSVENGVGTARPQGWLAKAKKAGTSRPRPYLSGLGGTG